MHGEIANNHDDDVNSSSILQKKILTPVRQKKKYLDQLSRPRVGSIETLKEPEKVASSTAATLTSSVLSLESQQFGSGELQFFEKCLPGVEIAEPVSQKNSNFH